MGTIEDLETRISYLEGDFSSLLDRVNSKLVVSDSMESGTLAAESVHVSGNLSANAASVTGLLSANKANIAEELHAQGKSSFGWASFDEIEVSRATIDELALSRLYSSGLDIGSLHVGPEAISGVAIVHRDGNSVRSENKEPSSLVLTLSDAATSIPIITDLSFEVYGIDDPPPPHNARHLASHYRYAFYIQEDGKWALHMECVNGELQVTVHCIGIGVNGSL